MPTKLKQPLRLADNLSAFDPQAPLILSPDMSSRIAIPIADRTAVPDQPTARGGFVHGIARRDQAYDTFDIGMVQTWTHEFNSAAEFYNFEHVGWPFAQLIRAESTGGPFMIHWYHGTTGSDLLMSFAETEIQLIRHPIRKVRLSCTGFPGTIWVTIIDLYP